jgi:hypothetical protein
VIKMRLLTFINNVLSIEIYIYFILVGPILTIVVTVYKELTIDKYLWI